MNDKSLNAKNKLRFSNNNCKMVLKAFETDLVGCSLPPDPKWSAEGWQRRFIADARMAREAIAAYKELGYEVKLEPLNTDELSDECGGCKMLLEKFSVVYTRKKGAHRV